MLIQLIVSIQTSSIFVLPKKYPHLKLIRDIINRDNINISLESAIKV